MSGSSGESVSDQDAGRSIGSAGPAEPRFIAIGRIVRSHGICGEVVVEVLTDFPERFDSLEMAYLGDAAQAEPRRVTGTRGHSGHVIVSFEGCPDRTSADALRGLLVQVPVEEVMPLPDGEYYLHQLVGLDVVTVDGEELGRIGHVLFSQANDVYVVNGPRGEILLPAIRQVIKQIDLAGGRAVVELMPGLVE